MDYKDYYKLLGVERSTSGAEIKKAFRKLAAKYHPDKKTGNETKFKEINEAYEVLGNKDNRVKYDQLGSNYNHGQSFQSPPGHERGFGGFGQAGQEHDFSDFFENMFNSGQAHGHGAGGFRGFSQKGEDQNVKLLISLEEAVNGAERSLTIQMPVQNLSGVSHQPKVIKVKIPAGVKQGSKIRLAGQGMDGAGGGAKGDLYLEIALQKHNLFKVDGDDVILNLPLTPWEAALGTKVEIPTLKGKIAMNIVADSQSGTKLRIKGRGLGKGSNAGNQLIVVQIHVPKAESAVQQEFYKNMQQAFKFNPRNF